MQRREQHIGNYILAYLRSITEDSMTRVLLVMNLPLLPELVLQQPLEAWRISLIPFCYTLNL